MEIQQKVTSLYIVFNKNNGKMYIGITTNLKNRWHEHRKHGRKDHACKNCYAIHCAMRKYGLDNFVFKQIEVVPSWSIACELEIAYIKTLKDLGYQLYNETDGGEGILGGARLISQAERQRRSEAMKGEKNYFYGKKLCGPANGNFAKGMQPHVKEKLLKIRRKLTKQQVDNIRHLFTTNQLTQSQLSVKYNVHLVTIHNIVNGRSWNDGNIEVQKQKPRLTAKDVLEIRALYESGQYTYSKLSERFNISIAQLSRIINRKKWANI